MFNVAVGDDFGGLDLSSAADESGGALDLLNVELDRPGRVRTRDGYSKVTASAGATRYDSVFPVVGASQLSVVSASASAGTFADDASVGTGAWAFSTGAWRATIPAAGSSHYLKATNFGLSVPSTATIVGVRALLLGGDSVPLQLQAAQLVKGGVIGGNTWTGDVWPDAGIGGASHTGSTNSLWGNTLTPANVNASTFGIVVSAGNPTGSAQTAYLTDLIISVLYRPAGPVAVAGASGSRLDVIAADGTISATVATASDTQSSYVAFGSPTTSAVYIANSGSTIRKLVSTTFSTPSGMPKAKYVGLQTPDNRLVAANIAVIPTGAGSTASTSLVHFSDSGAPETWSANNYAYLSPGDNEDIQGVLSWRNQTFVFKSTKMFVFYGNGTDSTGNPIFNYRQVTGAGLAAPLAVTASPDGVYFLDRRGIYYTTGGPAVRVSTAVDPLFLGGASPYFTGGTINPSALSSASMCWYSGRLYIGLALGTSAANDHTLVFDPRSGSWVLWGIPMGAMAASGSQPGVLLFTYATGTNDVGQYAQNAYTDDAGTAITAKYRSAFISLDWRGRNLRSGIHGVDKIVRESLIDGSGTVGYTLSNQWVQPASLPAARTLTLGTAPQVRQARDRTAVKGTMFSYQLSGTAPWSVEKVVWALHGYMAAGLKGDEGN